MSGIGFKTNNSNLNKGRFQFSEQGELLENPSISDVLNWIKGRIEYFDVCHRFEFSIYGGSCEYHKYHFLKNDRGFMQRNEKKRDIYIFKLSDLNPVIMNTHSCHSTSSRGVKETHTVEITAFAGHKITWRKDNGKYMDYLNKIASFDLEFADNNGFPKCGFVNAFNYAINYFNKK
jgi:hypothetical protein